MHVLEHWRRKAAIERERQRLADRARLDEALAPYAPSKGDADGEEPIDLRDRSRASRPLRVERARLDLRQPVG